MFKPSLKRQLLKRQDYQKNDCRELRHGFRVADTLPLNPTHHPAMNVPYGLSDGLPVGMILVGRSHAEPTIYRAVWAFEQTQYWKAA